MEFTVVGETTDYSCSRGTVLIDRASLGDSNVDQLVDVYDVYLPAGADADAARRRLQAVPIVAAAALCLATKNEISEHILGMIDRLYALALVQEGVVAATAGLGVLAATIVSVLLRRREFGVLRAQGATQSQIVRIVAAEAAILCGFGVALGIVAGFALDWFAVAFVLPKETGFAFPWVAPWIDAAALAAAAIGLTIAVGIGPGLHAARTSITRAVAYE
jgi:putative ABC transport system permease protein